MFDQLSNSKGESLAETLVASLIIGLAMIMVLTISQVSSSLSSQADEEFSSFYSKKNLYELLELETLNDASLQSSNLVTVDLYADGYLLGSDTVVVNTNSTVIDGNEIFYSYIE